ncbi:hypothetical protein BKA64DRAFT_636076 [Cadophora sp. MPI-SDFR-AT-0126]|nr:hypothetical protein BKA64DRAFT_636076 [Leotiomycetes sp. MPI-SDFR-AT-0126]
MKLIYSACILLTQLKCIIALPASSASSSTAISVSKPTSELNPPCQALCIKGYHSFYDPATKKCICVPDSKEEQKCVLETICVEYDIPMIPVWDDGTKKCSCKPKKDVISQCLASTTCGVGSPFWDPKTRRCTCVPRITEEQKCLQETTCIETDVPSVPDWDNITKTCSCRPRTDEEFICIAATTCLPGSSPYWDATTKKCNCLKTKPAVESAKRDTIPQDKPTKTMSPTPTPSPSIDTCTFLKVFCECGDHHMHWSEEKQGCECPACDRVVSLGCEDLKIYCNEGDHHMHWDPVSKKCQCPTATVSARKPPIKHNDAEVLPREESKAKTSPAPTPTPRVDHCPLLKILCPCGDRHSHWNEELQQCACQPCQPPPGIVCENYRVYCSGGDHRMHWDPITAKCQCLVPLITDYAPEPAPTM